jgi:pimeloyl-ACP methyl ester carboxylesterase
MAHGFTAEKTQNGKFTKIATSLNKEGYNIFTFDFSGCGESDNDTLTVAKQIDDLKSAIKFLKSKNYQNFALFGHSLGGLVSLKTFSSEIKTIVLWAPVTDKIKYTWDKRYSKKQLEELKEKDYITKIIKNKTRKNVLIDKQMLKERENINQKELLKKINCPVLIIHGKKDEHVPYQNSINAIKLLSKKSRLELIENANHSFHEHLNVIIDFTTKWFLDNFKK